MNTTTNNTTVTTVALVDSISGEVLADLPYDANMTDDELALLESGAARLMVQRAGSSVWETLSAVA